MGLQMKEKQSLTREVRIRYQKANRKDKSKILAEFQETTKYNRKYALRVLNAKLVKEVLVVVDGKTVKLKPEKKSRKKREGKRIYGDEVIASLRLIWEFFWWKCGKILAPLMRQQMNFMEEWSAFCITAEIREKLEKISPATIDRVLKKDKAAMRLKGRSCTKSNKKLKNRIPIRTFYTSVERKKPGFIQIDTVHHCADTTFGEYLLSLTGTDVYSGWVCLYGLLNKAEKWAFEAISDIRATLPFPLLEFHSDNGSEFINDHVEKWCNKENVPFTRSRSYKKNDKCVREYIGYDRLTTDKELVCVNQIYKYLNPLLNFFMPTMKLISKTKVGSKEIKKYDKPRSPYKRLMESPELSEEVKVALTKLYELYNPVILQHNVNKGVIALQDMVEQKIALRQSNE
jgi:hypothetical protein